MQEFKYNYSKKKFKKIICKTCGLCMGKPKFCYTMVYKKRPFIFISVMLPKLIKIRDAKLHCPNVRDVVIEVFCNQFTCSTIHEHDKGCHKLSKCIKIFKSQFGVYSFNNKSTIHTCKNESKIIKKATPYFFCNSDNKEWLKELEQYSRRRVK